MWTVTEPDQDGIDTRPVPVPALPPTSAVDGGVMEPDVGIAGSTPGGAAGTESEAALEGFGRGGVASSSCEAPDTGLVPPPTATQLDEGADSGIWMVGMPDPLDEEDLSSGASLFGVEDPASGQ